MKYIFSVMASLLMLLGSATSVFACGWFAYQPQTPKSLQK